VVELGGFGSSDPLGSLAGSGETLAYAHGDEVSTLGGPDCPASATALGAGGGRIAAASGSTIRIVEPSTCAVEDTLHAAGLVTAVALDDGLVASLSHGSAGRVWLEWFRLSTRARLGKREVAGTTLPQLAIRSPWILYRSTHALRVLATGSGRTWTVWRPGKSQLGARLLGRRIAWVENDGVRSRLWALRLPLGD